VKEDVLEQIVDDYLQAQGYFTRHNIKFRPDPMGAGYLSRDHSVHSDIDVIGVNPLLEGPARVWVVSCKSSQGGFGANLLLRRLRGEAPNSKRATWRHMRELWDPIWAEAFRSRIAAVTGSTQFQYSFAVTVLRGDADPWLAEPRIVENLAGNSFSFLTLENMWRSLLGITRTPEGSEIGRLVQLLKAAGLTEVPTPTTPPGAGIEAVDSETEPGDADIEPM
jgi:hypothetical protein